jgi:hypothetical protein
MRKQANVTLLPRRTAATPFDATQHFLREKAELSNKCH